DRRDRGEAPALAGHRRRPGGRVLVPRRRRVALDDRIGDRRRRRLRGAVTDRLQPDLSWGGVLDHHARRTPGKPIAVMGDRAVTYDEMRRWPAALAGGLTARGIGAGDVVGLLSYNSIEFLATIFAANRLGAIAMPVNWRLAAPELRFILEHSGARAL